MSGGEEYAVRRLRPEDAVAVGALRREALATEPLAFGSTLDGQRDYGAFYARILTEEAEQQAIFGAFEQGEVGGALVGMVGVKRELSPKEKHKAIVWGMFVTPRGRGKGAARALLAAAVQHARGWTDVRQVQLIVSAEAPAARHVYESAGFRVWGQEPRALQWEGRFVDELHMTLDLSGAG